jgi:hypothetical protein
VDLSGLNNQTQVNDVQDLLNERALAMMQDRSAPDVVVLPCGSFPGCGEGINEYLSNNGFEVVKVIEGIVSTVSYLHTLFYQGRAGTRGSRVLVMNPAVEP